MIRVILGCLLGALTKYKVAVTPTMLFKESKMLRFSLAVTQMDKIMINEYIRRTVQVARFGEKTLGEARLR